MIFHNRSSNLPVTHIRAIVIIAMLTALSVVSRVYLAFLPNVTLTTDILIITTLLMGIKYGIVNAVLTMVVSNMILGMGIWTIPQIISMMVIVIITGLCIRPFMEKLPLWIMALFAGSMGLLYGFIISLIQAPFFGFQYFFSYYFAGLPFDLMHAGGNLLFYYLLAPTLIPLLDKCLIEYTSGYKTASKIQHSLMKK